MVNIKSRTGEQPPKYDDHPASQYTAGNEPANQSSQPDDTELPALTFVILSPSECRSNSILRIRSRNDIVIAVMGVTGAGKTTFISHFAPKARTGHGLESCKPVPTTIAAGD
jgi:signal recognition particle GTPase